MRALPDSGLVVRLTRGRAWIAVLSVLLTGIVALNVISLSLSASQGKLAQQAQILEQENSVLRSRIALRRSDERVRNAAASLGMTAPEPTDINYRDASGQSVRLAARRLAAGFGLGGYLAAVPTTTSTESAPVSTTTTAAPAPTTVAASATPAAAPAATTVSAPTAPTTPTASSGGGVAPG
ncbi:MAG: hypothetical protein ACRDKV_10385 [Solirubrobacterales bacterium]